MVRSFEGSLERRMQYRRGLSADSSDKYGIRRCHSSLCLLYHSPEPPLLPPPPPARTKVLRPRRPRSSYPGSSNEATNSLYARAASSSSWSRLLWKAGMYTVDSTSQQVSDDRFDVYTGPSSRWLSLQPGALTLLPPPSPFHVSTSSGCRSCTRSLCCGRSSTTVQRK